MAALAQVGEKIDLANAYLSGKLDRASTAAADKLAETADKIGNNRLRGAFHAGAMIAAIGSKTAAAKQGDALTEMLNHAESFHSLRSVLSDMRGMTDSNKSLMRMINRVKAQIDALRQDFREGVPAELARGFSRKLKREEWQRMHKGFARADLMALGLADARRLAADQTLATRMVRDMEEEIAKLAFPLGADLPARYKAKAKALAKHMVLGSTTSGHLLRNAHAIAHLFGETGRPPANAVGPDLIEAIDRLTTLYAFQNLDSETRAILGELMETEAKGMEAVSGFLNAVRQMEIERRGRHGKTNARAANNNGWKGYVPALLQEGASLIVAEADQHAHLVKRGYVKVGTYAGDPREGRSAPRSCYQSTVAGRAQFRQGVAQTVHETWQGVDSRTGTSTGHHAGLVLGRRARRIAAQARSLSGSHDGLLAGDYLLPIPLRTLSSSVVGCIGVAEAVRSISRPSMTAMACCGCNGSGGGSGPPPSAGPGTSQSPLLGIEQSLASLLGFAHTI